MIMNRRSFLGASGAMALVVKPGLPVITRPSDRYSHAAIASVGWTGLLPVLPSLSVEKQIQEMARKQYDIPEDAEFLGACNNIDLCKVDVLFSHPSFPYRVPGGITIRLSPKAASRLSPKMK